MQQRIVSRCTQSCFFYQPHSQACLLSVRGTSGFESPHRLSDEPRKDSAGSSSSETPSFCQYASLDGDTATHVAHYSTHQMHHDEDILSFLVPLKTIKIS